MVAALLARGLEPFAAACAAVLAHARAGRDAAARVGAAESVIATDVIASIPGALARSAGDDCRVGTPWCVQLDIVVLPSNNLAFQR